RAHRFGDGGIGRARLQGHRQKQNRCECQERRPPWFSLHRLILIVVHACTTARRRGEGPARRFGRGLFTQREPPGILPRWPLKAMRANARSMPTARKTLPWRYSAIAQPRGRDDG